MVAAGVRVVWRCPIGTDRPGELARGAWDFLRRCVDAADAYVFSRRQYLWAGLGPAKAWFMPPVIDPFSPKNQELEPAAVRAILGAIGLIADGHAGAPGFRRADGTPGRVERAATLTQEGPIPAGARVVAQVSRWDRLKDPHGLLAMMEERLEDPSVHLVLAGPETGGVADDPEGFGLTVAEAMWKRRPVVTTRVGGIQDQVLDGETGLLIDDPRDLGACAAAVETVLGDQELARRMGEAGRQRVLDEFLAVHHLREYAALLV